MLGWLPRYSLSCLRLDLIAGVTVGLTVVPQALAYAEVAGLPVQVGGTAPGCPQPCPWELRVGAGRAEWDGWEGRVGLSASTGGIESYNHRMVGVGRDPKGHLVPLLHRAGTPTAPSVLTAHPLTLAVCRDGAPPPLWATCATASLLVV